MDALDIKAIFDALTNEAKYYESDVKKWLQSAQAADDDDAAEDCINQARRYKVKAQTIREAARVVRCALRDRGYEFDDGSEGNDAAQ